MNIGQEIFQLKLRNKLNSLLSALPDPELGVTQTFW